MHNICKAVIGSHWNSARRVPVSLSLEGQADMQAPFVWTVWDEQAERAETPHPMGQASLIRATGHALGFQRCSTVLTSYKNCIYACSKKKVLYLCKQTWWWIGCAMYSVGFIAKRWHGIACYSCYCHESTISIQYRFGRRVKEYGIDWVELIELLSPLGPPSALGPTYQPLTVRGRYGQFSWSKFNQIYRTNSNVYDTK